MTPMENEQAKRPALPLLALLAMASLLGVAVAVALAGLAMLLAVPAYAGEGSLLLERRGAMAEAERVSAEVESREEGEAVMTRVVEVYHNPFTETLAGVYLYRLPPDVVLERLSFTPGAAAAACTADYAANRGPGGAHRSAGAGGNPERRARLPHARRAAGARATAALAAARLLDLLELQHLDLGFHRRSPGLLAVADLLLATHLLESLAHVGVEARAVTEIGVEDVFHGVSCAGETDCSSDAARALPPALVSPDQSPAHDSAHPVAVFLQA